METALVRTLLNKDFYSNNKRVAKTELFQGELQKIKVHLDEIMKEYDRDISPSELEATFLSSFPYITTAQRGIYRGLFKKISDEQPLGDDLASNVFKQLWRQSFAEKITNMAFEIHNGDETSLAPLKTLLEKHEEDFLPCLLYTSDAADE